MVESGNFRYILYQMLQISFNYFQCLKDNFSVVNLIQYMGSRLKRDSVIVTFSEMDPEFYFVYLIILISDDNFCIVTKCSIDCYLNEHLGTYKIYHTSSCYWEIIKKTNLDNATVTHANKLSDGMYYICKKWM